MDNKTISNEATEHWVWESNTWTFVPPIILIVILVENSLAVASLVNPICSRLPSRITLIVLAVVDILSALFGLLPYWVNVIFGTFVVEWSAGWCKGFNYMALVCSQLSSCLVALLSVERFAATITSNDRIIKPIEKFGSLLVAILCAGPNMVQFFYLNLVEEPIEFQPSDPPEQQNRTRVVCGALNHTVSMFLTTMDLILYFLLPFVVILVCNTYIIHSIRKVRAASLSNTEESRQRNRNLVSRINGHYSSLGGTGDGQTPATPEQNAKASHQMTRTLLIVTFVFLLFNAPFTALRIASWITEYTHGKHFTSAWVATYILMFINNVLNFPIYFLTNPTIRRSILTILHCKR